LLCKTNNRVIAEYALRDVNKPIGIAEYLLVQALPAQLEANLPSIERLEAELTEADIDELEKIRHRASGDSDSAVPTAKPRPAPAGERQATKTAKTSPGKKPPRSTKPPRSKKAGR
jgi:hypothetical protein